MSSFVVHLHTETCPVISSYSGVVFNLKFAPQWETGRSLDEWTTRREYVRRGEGRDMVTATDAQALKTLPKERATIGWWVEAVVGWRCLLLSLPHIFRRVFPSSSSTYDWCTANEIWKWYSRRSSSRREALSTHHYRLTVSATNCAQADNCTGRVEDKESSHLNIQQWQMQTADATTDEERR